MSALGYRVEMQKMSGDMTRLDGDMTELSLLLPSWQAAALEVAAQDQGVTAAQMVRRLIRDFFDHLHSFHPVHNHVGEHGELGANN